jgi:type IV fimbrial biogenesis protein FimT
MKYHSSGFTLLEFLVTIAVLAVIVSIGVPNFRDFVRNSRMSAAANDIITDFNLARSEAVKRRVPVTLCKSQDGAACDADDTDPFGRWIVFVDDADPAVASADAGDGEVDVG